MILPAHNAKLRAIQRPAVPADAALGIADAPPQDRWTGEMQAYIDEDVIDQINGGQRVQIVNTIVDLPANAPVFPDPEDLLVLERLTGGTETLVVRMRDGGLLFLGRLRLICRAS